MIVQASKNILGFPPVEYEFLPAVFPKIYRRVNVVHTFRSYEPVWDGTHSTIVGSAFWFEATNTLVGELVDPLLPVWNATITGSHSGVLCSTHFDPATSTTTGYTRPPGDYAVLGPSPINGLFTTPDSLPTLVSESAVGEITDVGEGTVSSILRDYFAPGVLAFEFTTVITLSEPMVPADIRTQVEAMLATVPLQQNNQAATGFDGNEYRDVVSGFVGFESTRQEPYRGNVITLLFNPVIVPGQPVDLTLKKIIGVTRSTSDYACGPTCDPAVGRPLSFTPAAMEVFLPGGGTGAGQLFQVGANLNFHNEFRTCYPTTVGARGVAKKSLLARIQPDTWTLLRPQDYLTKQWGEAVCLGQDSTKCLRYYFPGNSDAGGGAAADNFSFAGDGVVWREIPIWEPPLPPCCPTGYLDFNNPCP